MTMRSQTGPFHRKLFIPEQRLESTCLDALRAMNLLPDVPSPIRIERFVFFRFGIEEEYEELPAGIMGCAKFTREGLRRIILNRHLAEDQSVVSLRRLRSTLAHEAGHGLFHTELFIEKLTLDEEHGTFGRGGSTSDSVSPDGFACRAEAGLDMPRPYEWWEYQANRAMAALLLPWTLVIEAAKERLLGVLAASGPVEDRVRQPEQELAELFDVNRRMVSIRLDGWWRDQLQQPDLF
jgi:hypothetical protein